MSGLYVPARSIELAKLDVGYHEGPHNKNKFSYWQYGQYYNPWCASAVSYWAYYAGFRFAPSSCGDKGEYNVATFHNWALKRGIWKTKSTRAKPGWFVNLNFGMIDAHIELVLGDNGSQVATIGGNTGDMVAYRIRQRADINGFIALDEAGQNLPGTSPLPPQEIKNMGLAAACIVPGSHAQTSGPWKGRMPMVGAWLNSDGTWDLQGRNGAVLANQTGMAFGVSVLKLGKLNAPIRSVDPHMVKDAEGDLKWSGDIFGLAEDGGTFNADNVTVKYG